MMHVGAQIALWVDKVGQVVSFPNPVWYWGVLAVNIINYAAQYSGIDVMALKRRFIAPLSPLPKAFFQQIEESNEKHPKAPWALVLIAEYDEHEKALSAAVTNHLILQIAKSYRIALKTIHAGPLWRTRIREAGQECGEPIELLVEFSHGKEDGLELSFGDESSGCWNFFPNLNISDLAEKDFLPLSSNATIILYSCCAGKGLAKAVAQVSQRRVLASKESISSNLAIFDGSLFAYNGQKKQIIEEFFPDGTSREIESPLDEHLEPFREKFEYIKQAAEEGDSNAQFSVALMLDKGILSKSEEEALIWYAKAAEGGVALAQFNMGLYSELGKAGVLQSDETALCWYRKAAEQKLDLAQFKIGLFYDAGRGGLERSAEEAYRWFLRSAKAGLAVGQFMSGLCHEFGRGVPQSNEEALHWYRLAKDRGISRAEEHIKSLESNPVA